jgi:prepilin-type N-terminal cleavage/methylation domain-containing protein
MKYNPLSQRGMTLIELVLATLIGAIILAAINGLVKLGLDAQTAGRSANELVYQGRFALERITDKARAIAPKTLTTLAANTSNSGDWFAPTGCTGAACVMYCLNAANQLIETTTADAACSGTTVLAGNVTVFTAAIGPGTRPAAVLSLTLANAGSTVTLSSSVRLGGGTQ